MHAITFTHPGGPEVLEWTVATHPAPTSTDVVIDVHATGVNNADLLQRAGKYPVPPGASPILGLECAGVISWVGGDVTEWAIGDRVCALLSGGAYAQQVVVSQDLVLPVPRGLDAVDAAALPEAACTVYSNLAMVANLTRGMTLLQHGGASGIGTFAIQWAKAVGARVVTTAGSVGKLERCLELGADVLVNYRTQDFVAETRNASGGRGADVILDIVGAAYLDRNLHALAPDGHLVVIGSAGDDTDAPLNLRLMMGKRARISGTTLRGRPHEQKAAIVREVRANVWPMIEDGRIVPVIDTVVSLKQAARAHELLEAGHTVGKVVLAAPLN
ncbi:NADPH2:quinone reductase [Glaciihabitans tibetensis]|uniref:NADPH2:quinone reductase n=2 Tax=Glaciihabitans tibetensis TaxID=1266600 RepID=A0A2T0V3C6_9MICO|nr:NADPH2:quinone reductase [Glaciihabitans tibetensis]